MLGALGLSGQGYGISMHAILQGGFEMEPDLLQIPVPTPELISDQQNNAVGPTTRLRNSKLYRKPEEREESKS